MTMTYNGATAGTTSANPPILLTQAMGGQITNTPSGMTGGKVWLYNSTMVFADLVGSSAAPTFTDGYALGMRAGDLMMGVVGGTAASSAAPFLGLVGGANTSSGAWLSSSPCWST